MKLLLTAALLAGTATAAHAQPGNVEPQPVQEPLPYQRVQVVHVDTVDEGTAIGLSLGGTVASWAMLVLAAHNDNENAALVSIGSLGTLLAPSFGHWYAHHGFTRGLGLRLLGVGAATIAFSMAMDHLFDDSENAHDDDNTIAGLMIIAGGLYIGGTIDDIATAGSAARKYNNRFEVTGIVPQINQNGGGFALAGRF